LWILTILGVVVNRFSTKWDLFPKDGKMSECALSAQVNDSVIATGNSFYDDGVFDFYGPEGAVKSECVVLMITYTGSRGAKIFWNVEFSTRENVLSFIEENQEFNIVKDDGDFYLYSGDTPPGDCLHLNILDFLPILSLKLMPSYLAPVFEPFIDEFKGEYRGVAKNRILEENLGSLGLSCSAKIFDSKKNQCSYGIVIA